MNIKGAGRKPKEEEERRNQNLKIRLSEHDLSRIQKLYASSHSKNRSVLVREILFKETIRIDIVNPELESALVELKGLLRQVQYVISSRSKNAMEIKPLIQELERSLLLTRLQMDNVSSLTMDDLHK